MPDFSRDLDDGHRAEERVLAAIRAKYPQARRIEGEFKYYDIIVPETGHRIEVKHDRYAPHNNRIAVEVSYRGKQSGIYVTTANYVAYVVGDRAYFIEPRAMLMRITREVMVPAGDDAMVVLLPINLVPWSFELSLITESLRGGVSE